MMSSQAERLMVRSYEEEPVNSPQARKRRAPLLRFARSRGRLTGMPVLTLLYPCTSLAELADPLLVGAGGPRDVVLADVAGEIESLLELLPNQAGEDDPVDDNWYWAAMVMLDLMTSPQSTA